MLKARPFDQTKIDAVSEFVARCTAGSMEPGWVGDVLTSVVSSELAVRDLWRGEERVGVGVSIDGLKTEGNAAELSIFSQPAGDALVCAELLSWGEARARAVGRDRVDVPDWPGVGLPQGLLSKRGYRIGHTMFDMERADDCIKRPQLKAEIPDGWRWCPASREHARSYYETVCAAWRGLPGAFVGTYDSFCRRLEGYPEPPTLLLSTEIATPVAGFVRTCLRDNGRGEVVSLGRHPHYRGCGLGEHLMVRAISQLEELGANGLVLEVAAANATGLALYRRFGFAVAREMSVYSLSLSPENSVA